MPAHTHQLIGSLVVALLIVVAAIAVVTAKFGAAGAAPRTPRGALKKVARAAHPATFARGSCLTSTPGNDPCLTDS